MNTVICYLTALAMHFVGINMTAETDHASPTESVTCEEHSDKTNNINSSQVMEECFPLFFCGGQMDDLQKKKSRTKEQIIG